MEIGGPFADSDKHSASERTPPKREKRKKMGKKKT
jgi:hypothetical protein